MSYLGNDRQKDTILSSKTASILTTSSQIHSKMKPPSEHVQHDNRCLEKRSRGFRMPIGAAKIFALTMVMISISTTQPTTVTIFMADAFAPPQAIPIRSGTTTIRHSPTSLSQRPNIITRSKTNNKQFVLYNTRNEKQGHKVVWGVPYFTQDFRSTTSLHMTPGENNSAATPSANNNHNDDLEWRALLASLTMYKAAFGDLKVPQRFVVPNMAPWPKPAWGMKLGKDVYAIRSTGKYISGNQKRRQQLETLGFVWSVRRSPPDDEEVAQVVTLEQVILAATTYQKLNNDVDNNNMAVAESVPDNYVVPDADPWPESVRGLPLGRQLQALLENPPPPAAQAKLQEFGILPAPAPTPTDKKPNDESVAAPVPPEPPVSSTSSTPPQPPAPTPPSNRVATASSKKSAATMSANDLRFEKVYTALETYKNLYGDLLVPQPFAVPNDSPEWPQETWGLRLGARVNAIRSQGTFVNSNPERRELLDELGFVWSPPKERRGRRGRKVKGDEEGGENFSSSKEEEDANVASSMQSIFDGSFDFGPDATTSDDDDDDDYDESRSAGPSAPEQTWDLENARLPELVAKAAEQEAAKNEEEYLPPRTLAESLEEATERAMEVGVIEGMTANKRVIKGKRDKAIPWFNDDFGDDFVYDDVVEALTTYKSIYGNFANLTQDFVVPTPKEVTGFLEDDDIFGARSGGDSFFDRLDMEASARAAQAIAELEEQGQTDRSEDLIAAEIKRLQEEVGQGLEKQTTTATTASETTDASEKWGEHLAGMQLGHITARIRDGSLEVKHIPERKAKLDAIGFDWGDPKYFIDVPFEKAMCAMYAYYLVRGDMFVYEDFIMPDEDPWPQALAGYELGKAVKRIRQLQNFLEAYHPDKVSLLRMIDFVWFSDTVALPLDPKETEMTSETLLLSAMGHPDFAKMIDIPMGLPDKIIADGPFMDTGDDPKLWWRKWHNWDYVKDYWYQQGRRDNAFVLRKMGYPQMADEHEAKYGPGLFKQIDEIMEIVEAGVEGRTEDEVREILETLNFCRQEMLGCSDIHPAERDKLLADLDAQMLIVMKKAKLNMAEEDELDTADYDFEQGQKQYEKNDVVVSKKREKNNVKEEEMYEDDEFDLEDELGLGGQ